MGDKGEEAQGDKIGADSALKDGPVTKRCCTDIICIPIFIVHVLAFWTLSFMNAGTGDPMKLIKPMDYKGDFCGIGSSSQWKGGEQPDLTDFPKAMWSMNLDIAFEPVAKEMVCGSTGYNILVSSSATGAGVTEADFVKYCGKKPAGVLGGLTDAVAAAAAAKAEMEAKVAKYTDPSKAADLFTGGSSSAGTGIMKKITENFKQVCMTKCEMTQATVSSARTYTYKPAPFVMWNPAEPSYRAHVLWSKFVAILSTGPQKAIISKFIFKAWDKSFCPYDDKLCVPMPGVSFAEVSDWNLCLPKIDPEVAKQMSGKTAEGLEALSKLSVTEDLSKTTGDVIADIIKTWQVFIIVAVLSMVVGLLVLVFMRFFLAPMVWLSLLVVFLIFIAGGVGVIVRSNQCANQSFVDAANTQATSLQNASATPGQVNPFDVECPGGYSIESADARKWAKIFGYVVLCLGGVWALAVLIMVCRIKLAIAVNQVACMFLYNNPQVLLVPILQNLIGILWIIVWCYTASFLLSQVPKDFVPNGAFATYAIAYGTDDVAGKCVGGGVFVDESYSACLNSTATDPLCYRCSPPRYALDWKFGYSFFSYLWHNFFFVAIGQCTIAGAVGIWFFTKRGEKWKKATVMRAWKNAIMWHSGSLAFGSLILAIVVWLKWFMTWLANQAKQTKNKVMEMICKVLAYVLWCFEKCVKFLNKNAYIQVALMGTNFCKSAKNAFFLILRNALRFMVVATLAHLVHFIAMALIIALTAILGYLILGAMYADVNPIAPTIAYCFIGWMTAKLFVGTFALAVDATLQCFIAAEEMGVGNDFAPEPLKKFIDERPKDEKPGCCDNCCCTVM